MTTDPHEHRTAVPAALLRRAGLRVTEQRVCVLTQVRRHQHADAETLVRATREQLGKVSTQAVYDVLGALADAGIVRRIEPAGKPALFEVDIHDNHHHVVCRECGRIEDVPCAAGRRPCLDAPDTHGFVIDEAEVVYWGICARCAPTQAPDETAGVTEPAGARHPAEA